MKSILVLLLVAAISVSVSAQTDPPPVPSTTIFVGAIYDKDIATSGAQISGRYGIVQPLGGHFYTLPNVEFGKYNSVSSELALLYRVGTSKWVVGPLAGPAIDWASPETDPLTYLTGAAGGIVAYEATPSFGLWLGGKYKFSFVGEDAYNDGFIAGLGCFFTF